MNACKKGEKGEFLKKKWKKKQDCKIKVWKNDTPLEIPLASKFNVFRKMTGKD
jgi:hypothetical protein